MNLPFKKILPIAILGGFLLLAIVIKFNPPEGQQRGGFAGPQMTVEITRVSREPYTVMLESYGTVQPRTQSTLTAQVGGQIVEVNPNLRDGGFFVKGDVLAKIDSRDYEANVRIASASLMDARQNLVEAEARTEQAREDWARLGNAGEPSELVLRLPQLEASKARVTSAESSLLISRLRLERTNVVAPFAGRVLHNLADVGQVVSTNTQIAEIYATDNFEIRLPIRNRDLAFIDLPEAFRNRETRGNAQTPVEISSQLGDGAVWDAKLVRTEGAIDETARQLHVIAMIADPFGSLVADRVPLKIGQYVTARLAGKVIPDALVIPNTAIYQGTYVYVVEEGVLKRRDIEIAWQNDSDAIINTGLEAGAALVTTPLGQITSGVRVSVLGEESAGPQPRGPGDTGPLGNRSDRQGRRPPKNGEQDARPQEPAESREGSE